MTYPIFIKEMRENVSSFKFLVFFVLVFLLVNLDMMVLIRLHKDKTQDFDRVRNEMTETMNGIDIYSDMVVKHILKPGIFSLFREGLDRNIGNVYKVSIPDIPSIENTEKTTPGNLFMAEFAGLDLTRIFILVMSIMAIFWGHNAVSGEKEDRTLGLVLSNPVSRSVFLLGKIAAGLAALLIPFLFSFITGIFIILFSGSADWGPTPWLIAGTYLVFSMLFIAVCYFISVFISVLTHKSSTALLSALLVWIVLFLVVPNISPYISGEIKQAPPRQKLTAELDNLDNEFKKEVVEIEKKIKPANFIIDIKGNFMPGFNLFGLFTTGVRVETNYQPTLDYMKEYVSRVEPLRLTYMDKIEKITLDRINRLKAHKKLTDILSGFSPAYLFSGGAAALCGTDAEAYETFIRQFRLYRAQLVDYFHRNRVFNSYDYFTSQFSKDKTRIIDRIPSFKYNERPFIERFNRALGQWIFLVLELIALWLGCVVLFMKYDPR